MGKIVVLNRISVDGFFATGNEKTWGMDWFIHDPEVDKAAHELERKSDLPLWLLFGGITYRGFESSWVPHLKNPNSPSELKAVADELTRMTKVVFSKTLRKKDITWENTILFNGNLIREISKLKEDADMMIMGSGTIIQQLAAESLIDEYVFILTPVISGEGKPLFRDSKQFGLKLISVQSFNSGNILIRYETMR